MSFLDPQSWTLNVLLLPAGKLPTGTDAALVKKQRIFVGAVYLTVIFLAYYWSSLVTFVIPEPYLDEVFHIPQAQRYCNADYNWDPKITTPPGLYGISILILRYLTQGDCTVRNLRLTNVGALAVLMFTIHSCRSFIEKASIKSGDKRSVSVSKGISAFSVHSTVNVCLFPPLFFFSGLYYTDVLSTCAVLLTYQRFLKREDGQRSVPEILGFGVFALSMRQTNIFWVAVFPAALDWIRACNSMDYKPFSRKDQKDNILVWTQKSVTFFARGNVHDLSLQSASIMDMFVCFISIGVAALAKLPLFLRRISPYISLLALFGGFVLWNGGVVLGDKSNHVATIHLPQMLYIWPFIAMFSIPLLYPYAIGFCAYFLELVTGRKAVLTVANIRCLAWTLLGLVATLVVVHFNTIIHPFTLADNRHFVFYAFKYSIRAHPLIKYALAPVYIISALLVYSALAGILPAEATSTSKSEKLKTGTQTKSWTWLQIESPQTGNKISLFLIWLSTSALCLVTAPLVEPRYYIISWIVWRLHVPPLPMREQYTGSRGWKRYLVLHDKRLWLETLWFLLINIVTGYILLFKGFEWPSEPGKIQRFMW